ncbi:MAG: hypothetical protein U9N38_05820, partial [Thermodesulfobacteriota bacterium]|nr:hypothetical protein [Thermodesulfobacteriota bacterium]
GKDFQIIKVVASVPFVSTKVSKINKDKGFEIAIKAGKNAPAGRINGEIEIHTGDPDQSLIKIPFYGLIQK